MAVKPGPANYDATGGDSARPAVLVTRPVGESADALGRMLNDAGYAVLQQPLLQLSPVHQLTPAQRQCLLDLDQFAHVIFISANAVRFGMEQVADYWPQLPTGINWYAIGEATGRLLASYQIKAKTPGANMSTEGILALPELANIAGERLLIVKGEGGRKTLATALSGRGARVAELACYRRSKSRVNRDEFVSQMAGYPVAVALISSGEGLQHLVELLSPAESSNFKYLCLIVPSERVARLALEAGFIHVVTADNASDKAMLSALEQWSSRFGE